MADLTVYRCSACAGALLPKQVAPEGTDLGPDVFDVLEAAWWSRKLLRRIADSFKSFEPFDF